MSAAVEAIRRWREHPVSFVREVLGAEPDAWQAEVLEAFPHRQRIAMKAAKGCGKSTIEAWLAWNFLLTRPHPKVVATSITGDNLKDGLWSEMAKWQARSPLLAEAFTWSAERIVNNDNPETWWMSARAWAKGADASQQANTLAGIHAEYVLIIADEVGGIPDAVVAAAEGGLSTGKETKLVIAGNPTHLEGPLYRACTRERPLWYVVEITGDPDSPTRSPRISVEWAREQIAKYGADNPWVLVNVFGQFPPASSNSLLGVEDVTAATQRTLAEADYREEPRILGVDVARFGDDRSIIFPRQGRAAMKPRVFRSMDTMQLAGQVALAISKWQPDATFIDVTGVGAGVVDRLNQLGHRVIGVDFGGKPNAGKFLNRRAEMWWSAADWVKAGGCLPNDSELISELTAPTYSFSAAGKLQLESKAELKARGLPSPDKADGFVLTFAFPVQKKPAGGRAGHGALREYDPHSNEVQDGR